MATARLGCWVCAWMVPTVAWWHQRSCWWVSDLHCERPNCSTLNFYITVTGEPDEEVTVRVQWPLLWKTKLFNSAGWRRSESDWSAISGAKWSLSRGFLYPGNTLSQLALCCSFKELAFTIHVLSKEAGPSSTGRRDQSRNSKSIVCCCFLMFLFCWFYFRFRILLLLLTISGTQCRKYCQVSQLPYNSYVTAALQLLAA